MMPNPRKPGSRSSATITSPIGEAPHPNPTHIHLAAQVAVRFAGAGTSFQGTLEAFGNADNVGMKHIVTCELCIDALKQQVHAVHAAALVDKR